MEKEDILINLKVIACVEVNEKLISRSQYLNKEFSSIVPVSLRRWIRQDSRQLMLSKVRMVIHSALQLLEEDITEHMDLQSELHNCIQGLRNLKDTYSHCSQTAAQIDVFIDSIG